MSTFDMQGFSKIAWHPWNAAEAEACKHEMIIRGIQGRLLYGWCEKCRCELEKLLDCDPVLEGVK
jgi:hypothetical protein